MPNEAVSPGDATRLWCTAPADRWLHALPNGNGRLGAMAFGGTQRDTLELGVGRHGQLRVWLDDPEEVEPGHRHLSHLFGIFPDDPITAAQAPELMRAGEVALRRRIEHGSGQSGWSRAWAMARSARFRDGDAAHANALEQLRQHTEANLFDMHDDRGHPPSVFQLDGNAGATAAVAGRAYRLVPRANPGVAA